MKRTFSLLAFATLVVVVTVAGLRGQSVTSTNPVPVLTPAPVPRFTNTITNLPGFTNDPPFTNVPPRTNSLPGGIRPLPPVPMPPPEPTPPPPAPLGRP